MTSWLAGKSKTNPTVLISFNSSGLKLLFLAKKCWKPFAFLSLSWQIAGVKPHQMLVPILKHMYCSEKKQQPMMTLESSPQISKCF